MYYFGLVFGKLLYLLWQILCCWANFQWVKNNIAIWSHWLERSNRSFYVFGSKLELSRNRIRFGSELRNDGHWRRKFLKLIISSAERRRGSPERREIINSCRRQRDPHAPGEQVREAGRAESRPQRRHRDWCDVGVGCSGRQRPGAELPEHVTAKWHNPDRRPLEVSRLFIYFLMGQSCPLFVYFRPFLIAISIVQIEKCVDGVLGIQNRGCK